MSRTSSLGYSARETSRVSKRGANSGSDSGRAELTIRQMSRLFGVSLRTLRFYEDLRLVTPRREGNARFYRAADRVRMEMILRGKKLGFTLAELSDLIGGKESNGIPGLVKQRRPPQVVPQIDHSERQGDEIGSATQNFDATRNRLLQGAAA